MKYPSLVALVIIGALFTGCSQESKTDATAATTTTKAKAEEYKQTDLRFRAALAITKGGGFSETMEGGVIKTKANGVTIAALSLGGNDIPLQSTNVTSDAMIVTKDYGRLLIKMNSSTFSCTVLVTPTQEAALRKLLAAASDNTVTHRHLDDNDRELLSQDLLTALRNIAPTNVQILRVSVIQNERQGIVDFEVDASDKGPNPGANIEVFKEVLGKNQELYKAFGNYKYKENRLVNLSAPQNSPDGIVAVHFTVKVRCIGP